MTAIGKRFIGPCNHPHEFVVGQFSACTIRDCSGLVSCKNCGSGRVEAFDCPSPLVPPGSLHCLACGRVWYPGV